MIVETQDLCRPLCTDVRENSLKVTLGIHIRFAKVEISSRTHEKVEFIFGFFSASFAKMRNYRSIGAMKLFLSSCANRRKTLKTLVFPI